MIVFDHVGHYCLNLEYTASLCKDLYGTVHLLATLYCTSALSLYSVLYWAATAHRAAWRHFISVSVSVSCTEQGVEEIEMKWETMRHACITVHCWGSPRPWFCVQARHSHRKEETKSCILHVCCWLLPIQYNWWDWDGTCDLTQNKGFCASAHHSCRTAVLFPWLCAAHCSCCCGSILEYSYSTLLTSIVQTLRPRLDCKFFYSLRHIKIFDTCIEY